VAAIVRGNTWLQSYQKKLLYQHPICSGPLHDWRLCRTYHFPLVIRFVPTAPDSVVNVSQIVTLDKQTLEEQIGQVSVHTLEVIEHGIRLVLDL
jgi:mRNA-degrading endonuclease toxin of MazEF toxin-antitoxin module